MSKKTAYYKLHTDGWRENQIFTAQEIGEEIYNDNIEEGQERTYEVEVVWMTDEEYEALPVQ